MMARLGVPAIEVQPAPCYKRAIKGVGTNDTLFAARGISSRRQP
jgi:hypothetical protein